MAAAPSSTDIDDGARWAMVQAETAWRHGEYQMAESQYRHALRETWDLLARLHLADGELQEAIDALRQATTAASANRPQRLALARLELHLASDAASLDAPINDLRLLSQQEPEDVAARRYLIEALLRAGKVERAQGQLQDLMALDGELAAALQARLDAQVLRARGRPSPAEQALTFPMTPLDDLTAALPVAQRQILEQRCDATLGRIYRNLAALQRHTERPSRADAYDALAAPYSVATAAPFGALDLDAQPGPAVEPPELDPVALFETLPETLRPVLRLVDRGDLGAAEALLRQDLETQEDPQRRDLLAAVLSAQGRHQAAEAELHSVLDMDPSMLSARQHLARLYYLRGEQDKGDLELRRAAELGPLERDLAFHLADLEIASQRIAAANHQLRSLARRFESARAQAMLSRNARQMGNRKGAVDASRRALRLAPDSEEILQLHTVNALQADLVDDAVRAVEPLARMHPEVAAYQFLLGSAWRDLGNPREAAEAFLRAVQLDPDHQPAFLPLGLALNHESRFAEAKVYLDRALAQSPDDAEILAALAEAEERLGNPTRANTLARQALSLEADQATAHLVLGLLDMAAGRFDAARLAFEQAVADDPELSKAHYQLSLAYARLGDADASKRHLDLYRQAQAGPEGSHTLLTPSSSAQQPTPLEQRTGGN